mmetsp:Transcript_21913/g.68900  ORF Transcript_21913/g.68900 Transcript_21913/m.68900 type:complete len:252 (+) Transcript_21913:1309-2064(+)
MKKPFCRPWSCWLPQPPRTPPAPACTPASSCCSPPPATTPSSPCCISRPSTPCRARWCCSTSSAHVTRSATVSAGWWRRKGQGRQGRMVGRVAPFTLAPFTLAVGGTRRRAMWAARMALWPERRAGGSSPCLAVGTGLRRPGLIREPAFPREQTKLCSGGGKRHTWPDFFRSRPSPQRCTPSSSARGCPSCRCSAPLPTAPSGSTTARRSRSRSGGSSGNSATGWRSQSEHRRPSLSNERHSHDISPTASL